MRILLFSFHPISDSDGFSAVSASSDVFLVVAHPGARTWCHALPWWALRCSLSSRTASSLTKYSDYDYMLPPMESNLRKGPCRARDGVGLLFVNFNCLYRLTVYITVASLALH